MNTLTKLNSPSDKYTMFVVPSNSCTEFWSRHIIPANSDSSVFNTNEKLFLKCQMILC